MPAKKLTKKRKQSGVITAALLNRPDYYRNQVKIARADKPAIAACYNAISDLSPEVADDLRDKFSKHIIRAILETTKTLLSVPEWRERYKDWLVAHVGDSACAEIVEYLNKHFPDLDP